MFRSPMFIQLNFKREVYRMFIFFLLFPPSFVWQLPNMWTESLRPLGLILIPNHVYSTSYIVKWFTARVDHLIRNHLAWKMGNAPKVFLNRFKLKQFYEKMGIWYTRNWTMDAHIKLVNIMSNTWIIPYNLYLLSRCNILRSLWNNSI